MTWRATSMIVTAVVCAAGCGNISGGDCITIGRWALAITVHDSATGAALVDGVSIRTSGVEVDSIPTTNGDTLNIGLNSGVYTVIVTKSGYKDFTKSNINVTLDQCRLIETVKLDVKLLRATE